MVDIFDGGPTVTCRRDQIATIRASKTLVADVADAVDGRIRLISNGTLSGFRACNAAVDVREETATISAATARALRIEDGMLIRVRL